MSTLSVDTITGESTSTTITIGSTPVVSASANSMTIRGEGSNQTSIQQGLAKVWINFDGSSLSGTGTTGVNDSFNVTNMTDNGTGDYTTNITNNMGNTNYCHLVHAIVASSYTQYLANSFAKATGSYREEQDSFDGSSTTANRDHTHCNLGILGDLA